MILPGRTRQPTYRCPVCRRLMHGPEGQHGNLCPECDTGRLQNVARINSRMLAEHETALVDALAAGGFAELSPWDFHRKV